MPDQIIVLFDKCVDLKRLKKLEAAGLIEPYQLDLENRAKSVPRVPPLGVYGMTEYGRSVYAGDEDAKRLKDILGIMGGPAQIQDALTVDAAFRNSHLYVVTNDKN